MNWLTRPALRLTDDVFVSDMPTTPAPAGPRPQEWFSSLAVPPMPGAADEDEVVNARARFGERSRSAEAARAAHRNGAEQGFKSGYISGMHWGLMAGAIAGALLVCLLLGADQFVWPHVAAWFAK